MTEISFTNISDMYLRKRVYRMCSRKINQETDTTLSLVDIMMASSAFPIAFPPVRIQNVRTIPNAEYVDGGVGDDHVPFRALIEFEKFRGKGVERVYIISRKSDSIPEVGQELEDLGIKDRKIYDRLGVSLENFLKKGIIKRLEAYEVEAPDLKERTYIWIPDFKKDFPLMNFDDLKEQYDLTQLWAHYHNPVPLEEFLSPYRKNEKSLGEYLLKQFPLR
jgi:predicted acylesterase/phospholipase RssA